METKQLGAVNHMFTHGHRLLDEKLGEKWPLDLPVRATPLWGSVMIRPSSGNTSNLTCPPPSPLPPPPPRPLPFCFTLSVSISIKKVLIVHGDADEVASPAASLSFYNQLPSTHPAKQYVTIPGGYHEPHNEPKEIMEEHAKNTAGFLVKHSRGGSDVAREGMGGSLDSRL